MQRAYHESGVWQHLKGGRVAQGLIKGGAGHRDPMTHLPHLYEDNTLFVDDAISRLRGKQSDKSPDVWSWVNCAALLLLWVHATRHKIDQRGTRTRNPQIRSLMRYPIALAGLPNLLEMSVVHYFVIRNKSSAKH